MAMNRGNRVFLILVLIEFVVLILAAWKVVDFIRWML
jgi:hypothetical protein